MTDELGRFTSDRRVRDDASWATQDDWGSGVAENVDITASGLVAQPSVQNSEMPDSVVAHWPADDLSSGFSEWVDRESGLVFDNNGATYTDDGVNGNPSIILDGTDWLVGPDDTELDLHSSTTEKTVCIVYEPTAQDVGYLLYHADSRFRSEQGFSMLYGNSGNMEINLGGGNNNLAHGFPLEPHIVSATWSRPDSAGTVGISGSEIDANAGNGEGKERPIHLGARPDDDGVGTGAEVHIEARVGDIIVAEGRSIEDYRAINDVLSDKYGIALS